MDLGVTVIGIVAVVVCVVKRLLQLVATMLLQLCVILGLFWVGMCYIGLWPKRVFFPMRMAVLLGKNASSSIGRVAVSKTVGWGFESLLACG